MKIKDMKIGTRLGMGFGVICLALVFTVGQGVASLSRVNDGSDIIVDKRIPRLDQASRLLSEVNDIAIALRNEMLSEDPADRAKQVDEILSSRKEADAILANLDKMLESEKGRALLRQQQELNAKYVKAQDELMGLVAANDLDGAKARLKIVRPLLAEYKKAIADQIQMQKDLAARDSDEATASYLYARNLMLALGVLAVLGAGALAWWISASIVRPMRRALDVANAVAAGDLTTRVEVTSKCEAGQLLAALKTMNENLVQPVATVRSGTEAIGTASGEVAAGNQDLSSRTEQQASSLEETASSM